MAERSGSQGDPDIGLSVGTEGRSATVGYPGPPEANFSESPQIPYLGPKMPIFRQKKKILKL